MFNLTRYQPGLCAKITQLSPPSSMPRGILPRSAVPWGTIVYCVIHLFDLFVHVQYCKIRRWWWNVGHGVFLVFANVSINIIVDGRQMGRPTPLLQMDLHHNSPISSRWSKICARGCCRFAIKFIHMTLAWHYEYNVIASNRYLCSYSKQRG